LFHYLSCSFPFSLYYVVSLLVVNTSLIRFEEFLPLQKDPLHLIAQAFPPCFFQANLLSPPPYTPRQGVFSRAEVPLPELLFSSFPINSFFPSSTSPIVPSTCLECQLVPPSTTGTSTPPPPQLPPAPPPGFFFPQEPFFLVNPVRTKLRRFVRARAASQPMTHCTPLLPFIHFHLHPFDSGHNESYFSSSLRAQLWTCTPPYFNVPGAFFVRFCQSPSFFTASE